MMPDQAPLEVRQSRSIIGGVKGVMPAFLSWVRSDPVRAFGMTGLAGDISMLAAGGVEANPLLAYCGLSGLMLQALNSRFGSKIAPLTNALLVIQGVAMTLAGKGVAGPVASGGMLMMSGLAVGGAGAAMGMDGWLQLIHRRSAKPARPGESQTIDVTSSTSRPVGLQADLHRLGQGLGRFAERMAERGFSRRNLISGLFTLSSGGLVKSALATPDPKTKAMMLAAALCFTLSTLMARVDPRPPKKKPALTQPEPEPRRLSP